MPASELFFRACGFKLLPIRLREHEQVVEFAGALQPLAAVNHNTFAVDIGRHIADEKSGKIGEFFVAAEALHGMRFARVVFELFRGDEA